MTGTPIDSATCFAAIRSKLIVLRTALRGAPGEEAAALVDLIEDAIAATDFGLETVESLETQSTPADAFPATGLGANHAIAGLLVSGPDEKDSIH